MVDKTNEMLDLLKNKYGLRVQLSGGESARLIGSVHQIFLTVGRQEQKFHLGNEELEDLIVYLAWKELGVEFKPDDMRDLKKELKKITNEETPLPPKK
jgi:hypothetical protein